MTDEWMDHARDELEPKMRSSAFVITVNPREIEPKIALETGYAVLLGKPIVLVAPEGYPIHAGLESVATRVVRLPGPLDDGASQMLLQSAIAAMKDGRVKTPAQERDQLRMVIRNAIDNIAHGRHGHAIRQLRAARDTFE